MLFQSRLLDNEQGRREVLRRLLESAQQTEKKFQRLEGYAKELESLIAILIEALPEERKDEVLHRLAKIAGRAEDGKVVKRPNLSTAPDLRSVARRMLDRFRPG